MRRGYNKFIIASFIFLLTVLFTMFAIWKATTWTRSNICHNPNATTLVMGNSRIQYGFDDSQVLNTWNVGLNADNYNIIYWKLQILHRYNPQIKKLILLADESTLFSYFQGVEYKLHPYYWDVINIKDWVTLLKEDRTLLLYPLDWKKTLYPLKSLFSPIQFSELGIGGYAELHRDKLQESLRNERKNKAQHYEANQLQIEYLKQIISYCKSNHIEIEFINMPSYPTESVRRNNCALNQYLKHHFPHITFHDYELIELADSCYGDITHLNYRGARELSRILKTDFQP